MNEEKDDENEDKLELDGDNYLKAEENTGKHALQDSLGSTYFDANDAVEQENARKDDNEDKKEEPKIMVALNADGFVYDAETKKYTLTLKGVARVIQSDFYGKTVTIEIDEGAVNKEKSDLSETQVDEILDEIEKTEENAAETENNNDDNNEEETGLKEVNETNEEE